MAKKQRVVADPASEVPAVRQLVARLSGARLCYGKPVKTSDRVVIPVASLRTAGGGGFGRNVDQPTAEPGVSGGGGGALEARPVGFIEIGPDGTRFQRINDPGTPLRALAAALLALVAVRRLAARRSAGGPPVTLPGRARLRLALPRR